MDPLVVLGFAAVALTLIAVPGPDWAYVLAAGAHDHVVAPAVAGIATGYVVVTGVVSLGVGALVAQVPVVLTALTGVGAAYLAYLGVRTVRSSQASLDEIPVRLAGSSLGYLGRGAGVSALNPKGLLLFVSILPQFARPTGWPLAVQLAVLGGVFVVLTSTVYAVLGCLADRVFGARPALARATTRFAGIAMVVVGGVLLAERLVAVW